MPWKPLVVPVLVVVGCLATLVGNLAVWSRLELLDTDRFVGTLAPLADDDAIVDGVAAELTGRVRSLAPGVPADVVEAGMREVLESPQFRRIWTSAVREAHVQLLDLIHTNRDEVGLDLDEVLKRVDRVLRARGIDVLDAATIERIDDIVPWSSDYLRRLVRIIDINDRLAVVLPPLAVGLFVAAVLLAENRRRTLFRIGLGVAGAMVATAVLFWIGRRIALGKIDNPVARRAAADVWDHVFTSLNWQTGLVFLAGGTVAFVGWASRHRAAGAALLLAVTTVACGNDDDSSQGIDWDDCGKHQCAQVAVPLDYATPGGETIEVSVLRVPATGDRVGALFVNPGGPGARATEYAKEIAPALPKAVRERFDIVGVDPRGLGADKIDCGKDDRAAAQDADYTIESAAQQDELIAVNRRYADACQAKVGSRLRHLSTRDVARDMDRVRAAMGDAQLSYLGTSYGTALGQVYAELFPQQVRGMVLDAVADLGPSGIDFATAQANGFEQALGQFAQGCAADDNCPIKADPLAAVDQVAAQLAQGPIPAQPHPLTQADWNTALSGSLYTELAWTDLGDGVAKAAAGDGSKLVDLATTFRGLASFDVYNSVFCTDWGWPATPQEILAAGTAATATAPHFAEPIVNDYLRCALWPVRGEPLAEVTAPGSAPILVVATTHDPATPYAGAVDTAQKLGATLLTLDDQGHGAIGLAVPCIDDAVYAYLLDGTLPPAGTVCTRP